MQITEFSALNEVETINIAKKLAAEISAGDTIELVGDIGSGKTFFTKTLVNALGSNSEVSSPTFVLKNEYIGDPNIHHYDLYRLEDTQMIKQDIAESINSKAVVIVEWGKTVDDVLPPNRAIVEIIPTGENSRKIIIKK